ncbi:MULTISPECIES: hypothetical protein [unclassified Mesorhizobium]|uniref:hypothetical protein n=1 Tax=unclassified Mesorhizobium TaxID=325217 RepID=UPI000FDC2F92|nr:MULTISPECIES: hypothetical protein [unclassified Mesorhizobium]TGR39577.1 hypothetical protein EN842_40815 [bacterium M00.F.Ca.ET.199.01.1.1]TGU29014.1 hypothetical protein EN799_35990 [bacterium M00.F.Ca.ET.156.01.1.1]TGV84283.1 hypothetical protein EN792_021500 [Mesorhizobium sp. M00.F.Ca.ET.149.01.1.1]TGR22404.1 hypothetical protein EN845_22130 [Mesorhizobium sp. M8A.F.Ca.ET.202.01.1.1]TGR23885.1 hypothetical protein EN840_20775 [Mesorhizobium sp. M8A.F.Ca.ET.197.01.1.1]
MSNEIVISENPGAAGAGSATGEGLTGGAARVGFASLPADPTRKAEIEAVMRSDFARYESEGLDQEYAALLQGEIEAANPDAGKPTAPMPADASRATLCSSVEGQRLVYDWSRDGAFQTRLANVQKDVGEIVREAGNNRRQRAFMERFTQEVPAAVEVALMDEFATGAPWSTPASSGEIDLFATTPAGKIMVQHWGAEAAEKVGVLRQRAARLTDMLDEDSAADLWAWFENLDTHVITKIYRKMAGG